MRYDLKRYFNFNKLSSSKDLKNTYFYNETKSILICNSFSIVRLNFNCNNKNELKRYNNFMENCKENMNETLNKQVIDFENNFANMHFCERVDLKDNDEDFVYYDNITNDYKIKFNKSMIKNISKLVGGSSAKVSFYKNTNINDKDYMPMLSIVGKYGYAYLLGARVY